MNFVMHKLWIVLQVVIFLYELLICRIEKLLCPLWCKKPWITQMHDDDDDGGGDDFDEDAMLLEDSGSLSKLEEGSSEVKVEVEEEEEPKKSTLGARLLFAKAK